MADNLPVKPPPANSRDELLRTNIEMTRRWILRGIKSAEDIQAQFKAQKIEVSLRTVFRYIATVKSEGEKAVRSREGLNKTMDEIAIDLRQIIDEVSRELWKQYHAPIEFRAKCPHPEHRRTDACGYEAVIRMNFGMVKVMALKEIRAAAKEWVEMMQTLGLAYKAPEKGQMIGADGKPVDPTININVSREEISHQFVSFMKAKFQNPVGTKNIPTDIPDELKPKEAIEREALEGKN